MITIALFKKHVIFQGKMLGAYAYTFRFDQGTRPKVQCLQRKEIISVTPPLPPRKEKLQKHCFHCCLVNYIHGIIWINAGVMELCLFCLLGILEIYALSLHN